MWTNRNQTLMEKKNNFGFFKFGGLDLRDFDIVTDC